MAVGIENPSQLDLVTTSNSGDEVALIMIAAEPWTDENVMALQAKTESYLPYVETGGLAQDYPSSVGKRIRLQLDTAHPVSELAQRFISIASSEWCAPLGIRFVVNNA